MTDWKNELETLHEHLVGVLTDQTHAVRLGESGWTVQHPISCRPNMLTCPVTGVMTNGFLVADEDGEYNEPVENVYPPGLYSVTFGDVTDVYGWTFTPFDGNPSDPVLSGLTGLLGQIERLVAIAEGAP